MTAPPTPCVRAEALDPDLAEQIAPLLEMRVRVRRNPHARALIDWALAIVAEAHGADATRLAELRAAVEALTRELELRFGAPRSASIQ
jgi:hypothetical protein